MGKDDKKGGGKHADDGDRGRKKDEPRGPFVDPTKAGGKDGKHGK